MTRSSRKALLRLLKPRSSKHGTSSGAGKGVRIIASESSKVKPAKDSEQIPEPSNPEQAKKVEAEGELANPQASIVSA
jgi:hypothetical protein